MLVAASAHVSGSPSSTLSTHLTLPSVPTPDTSTIRLPNSLQCRPHVGKPWRLKRAGPKSSNGTRIRPLDKAKTFAAAEETKAALRSKDVQALTSKNIKAAVSFLAQALEAELEAETNPMDGPMAPPDRPAWDSSKTPEGRHRYLKRLEKADAENFRKLSSNPSLKSPDKVGWDHERYYKTGGIAPANALQKW